MLVFCLFWTKARREGRKEEKGESAEEDVTPGREMKEVNLFFFSSKKNNHRKHNMLLTKATTTPTATATTITVQMSN